MKLIQLGTGKNKYIQHMGPITGSDTYTFCVDMGDGTPVQVATYLRRFEGEPNAEGLLTWFKLQWDNPTDYPDFRSSLREAHRYPFETREEMLKELGIRDDE